MRWPWTSKARLDDKDAEIKRLQAIIAGYQQEMEILTDAITRMGRFQSGMPETPRRAKPPIERMPLKLYKYIKGYSNPSIKKEMLRRANTEHRNGRPWPEIAAEIMGEELPDGTEEGQPTESGNAGERGAHTRGDAQGALHHRAVAQHRPGN